MLVFLAVTSTACATLHLQPSAALTMRTGDSSRVVNGNDLEAEQWFFSLPTAYLYHGQRRLGEVNWYSVSPSGTYLLFEKKGRLWLYNTRTAVLNRVSTSLAYQLDSATWNEADLKVLIDGYTPLEHVCEHLEVSLLCVGECLKVVSDEQSNYPLHPTAGAGVRVGKGKVAAPAAGERGR